MSKPPSNSVRRSTRSRFAPIFLSEEQSQDLSFASLPTSSTATSVPINPENGSWCASFMLDNVNLQRTKKETSANGAAIIQLTIKNVAPAKPTSLEETKDWCAASLLLGSTIMKLKQHESEIPTKTVETSLDGLQCMAHETYAIDTSQSFSQNSNGLQMPALRNAEKRLVGDSSDQNKEVVQDSVRTKTEILPIHKNNPSKLLNPLKRKKNDSAYSSSSTRRPAHAKTCSISSEAGETTRNLKGNKVHGSSNAFSTVGTPRIPPLNSSVISALVKSNNGAACASRKEENIEGEKLQRKARLSQFQVIHEEIPFISRLRPVGLYFDSELEQDSSWADAFAKTKGVTCQSYLSADTSSRKQGKGKRARRSNHVFPSGRYRASMTYKGVSLNLGSNHLTSAEAAAAIDLGQTLLQGSEYQQMRNVLSRSETISGLKAAGVSTSHGDRIDPLLLFKVNEFTKPWFEAMVEDALTSLGGKDYQLSNILAEIGDEDIVTATSRDENQKTNSQSLQGTSRVEEDKTNSQSLQGACKSDWMS